MSNNKWAFILLSIIIVGCLYIWISNFSPPVQDNGLEEKLTNLSYKLDSIRRANDSIKVIIDTTEVEIEHVYEKYIQTYDRIVVQSVDSDCIFFSNYLSEDNKRFVDTINFKSAETY